MMPPAEPLHPRRDDGSVLDATFEVACVPVFDIVFHHKSRGKGDPRAENQDYHEALELLLARLAERGATILEISVDSRVARALPPAERRLALDFPIRTAPDTDVQALRLRITSAQKPIARRPDARPGGGNDQRRIRMRLTVDTAIDLHGISQLLVHGSPR